MEIKLRSSDVFRIETNVGNNFIDIKGVLHEHGILVQAYPYFHYIEVREKQGQIATFYFQRKSIKKDTDIGWWEDAAVVFSRNNVRHK